MPSATSRKSLGLSFCCPYIKWGWVYMQTDANEGAQDLEINLLSENKPFSLQNKCILTLHHSSKACYPGLQPKSPRAHFTITEVLKKPKIQESPPHPTHPKSFQTESEGFKLFCHHPLWSSPTLPSSPAARWRVSACQAALFPHAAAPWQQEITWQTQ